MARIPNKEPNVVFLRERYASHRVLVVPDINGILYV